MMERAIGNNGHRLHWLLRTAAADQSEATGSRLAVVSKKLYPIVVFRP